MSVIGIIELFIYDCYRSDSGQRKILFKVRGKSGDFVSSQLYFKSRKIDVLKLSLAKFKF